MIAAISDDVLLAVNSLELVGIVYLALAISALRERVARFEGLLQGKREEGERK